MHKKAYLNSSEVVKKLSLLNKLYLKYTNPNQYRDYKYLLRLNGFTRKASIDIERKDIFHFKHSGNAGDIIYSLPAIYSIAGEAEINLHLKINVPTESKVPHPGGNVLLNESMADKLLPLLLHQKQIKNCEKYRDSQVIDVDLDLFREMPFQLDRGSIPRWYLFVFGINADLGLPWLKVKPDLEWKNHIIIARSERYRALGINYSFLRKYPNLAFVGVEDEFNEMRLSLPSLQYIRVNDFLELAQVIAAGKFFIGNQSFPFSIAEGLKIKRILEVSTRCPNVIVEGINGYDFCFQQQFEKIVQKLYSESD